MEYDTDPLCYDVWIEDALRTVIKRTISYVSENGLPGEHHFYITFRTTDDKVIMPDYLRADHPEEMTIVLQYQSSLSIGLPPYSATYVMEMNK